VELVFAGGEMAILRKDESGEDLRRRIIEEAEEEERRNPLPPIEEVLAEIQPWRPPKGTPDSTALIRAVRDAMDDYPLSFSSDSKVRERLIEAAEEYLRRIPNPRLKEALEEIRGDSTTLTGEDQER
jgi:vacuolar-type H+-ATPase subunit E/Vma4